MVREARPWRLRVFALGSSPGARASSRTTESFDQGEALGLDSSGNNHAAPFTSGTPPATAGGVSGVSGGL